jgi:hypothetical protein
MKRAESCANRTQPLGIWQTDRELELKRYKQARPDDDGRPPVAVTAWIPYYLQIGRQGYLSSCPAVVISPVARKAIGTSIRAMHGYQLLTNHGTLEAKELWSPSGRFFLRSRGAQRSQKDYCGQDAETQVFQRALRHRA